MSQPPESSHRDHETESDSVRGIGFGIITLSDTRNEETDRSGQYLKNAISEGEHSVHFYRIVVDDPDEIAGAVEAALGDKRVNVLVTNGGTGISNRDSAFEVISAKLEKKLDGFGELFRALSYEEIGAAAMLSRAVAGTVGRKVIFALPGSTNAVRLGFDKLILPQAAHLHRELHKDLD